MVTIKCTNRYCEGSVMEVIDNKATHECRLCHRKKIHTREYDEKGLVKSDKVEDV